MKQNRAVRSDAWDGGLFPAGTSSVYSQPHLALIRELAEPVRLFAGDYLYQENDPADRLYFVNRGSLKVSKRWKMDRRPPYRFTFPAICLVNPIRSDEPFINSNPKPWRIVKSELCRRSNWIKSSGPTVTLPWSIWAGWHSCSAPRKANYATSRMVNPAPCALCSCGCTICTGRAGQTRKLERSSASGLRIWKWRR